MSLENIDESRAPKVFELPHWKVLLRFVIDKKKVEQKAKAE